MMRCAITVSLVPEARGGPFVFWDDLEAACAQAEKLGFHAIEIFPRDPGKMDMGKVRQTLERHGLKLAAMGTGAGWVVHKLRLTDPDERVRERAQAFVSEIIQLAASLDAPAIIGSMQGRHEGHVSRDRALGWLRDALEELGPQAQDAGTSLLIEPLNRYETNLLNGIEDSAAFLHTVGPRNVKLLCDLFHMNIEEPDLPAAFGLAGPLVGHVHFADSNRRAIGFGHTQMGPIIEALEEISYSGYLSAEILPLPDPGAAAEQTIASFRKWVSHA